jgi:hypothetical protein
MSGNRFLELFLKALGEGFVKRRKHVSVRVESDLD